MQSSESNDYFGITITKYLEMSTMGGRRQVPKRDPKGFRRQVEDVEADDMGGDHFLGWGWYSSRLTESEKSWRFTCLRKTCSQIFWYILWCPVTARYSRKKGNIYIRSIYSIIFVYSTGPVHLWLVNKPNWILTKSQGLWTEKAAFSRTTCFEVCFFPALLPYRGHEKFFKICEIITIPSQIQVSTIFRSRKCMFEEYNVKCVETPSSLFGLWRFCEASCFLFPEETCQFGKATLFKVSFETFRSFYASLVPPCWYEGTLW